MTERQNRTIICSVLFLDLVGYSRRPVSEQLKLRDRFNLLLREALKGVAANDRIILDTGDGAAVTFLGDPEDALFMALTLRDLVAQAAAQDEQELHLRSGINLGPVKLVKDLNGRPNIIGDGINVAQRIMGFSQPGQVLISRSYYEVASRLSDDYSRLFKDEGVRTDKHVREHQVYGVLGDRPTPVRSPQDALHSGPLSALGSASAIVARLNDLAAPWLRSLIARPRVTTAFVAIAILALGGVVRASREPSTATLADRDVAAAAQPAALIVPAPVPPAAGIVEKPATAPALPTETGVAKGSAAGPLPTAPSVQAQAPQKGAAAKVAAAKPVAAKPAKAVAAKSAQQEDSQVAVSFAVFPWGDVYVDGRHLGVSPPIRNIRLPPGRHEIEFRNTTFPNHVQVVEIKPGEPVTMRHKFQGGASQ